MQERNPGLFIDYSVQAGNHQSADERKLTGLAEESKSGVFNKMFSSLKGTGSETNLSGKVKGEVVAREKTKVIKKGYTELNSLILAQEVQCGNDAIWVIKFRADGLYCAVGGNDGILRVFKTIEGAP